MSTNQLPTVPNFPELEHKWLSIWEKQDILQKYLHKNDDSERRFSFIDGPITANNPMGVHHGWGRTYKDMWQRFFNLTGHKQRFQNGFDCQGLWVEVEVEKELNLGSKKEIENLVKNDKAASIDAFVQLCKDRVLKYSAIQTQQSKRLGYFMDWDHSYFTMSDENNYMIWHFLKVCFEKDWIYKGTDSVPWCPRCETAISQHEMLTEDYKEVKHDTVFFRLPITTQGWENTYLLVWTTTPWTIPANVAVGINSKYTYGTWEDQETKEKYIFLYSGEMGKQATRDDHEEKGMSMEKFIMKNSGKTLHNNGKNILGTELIGLTYIGPFDDLPIAINAKKENEKTFHTVIDAKEVVTDTEGTGLLHVAPGAGQEDFKLGKQYNLPVIAPILDNADYAETMGKYSGKNAKNDPLIIIKDLKAEIDGGKYWFKKSTITHRYPACWRCKTELVWKVAEEWYIAMDKPDPTDEKKRTYRQQMQDVTRSIQWLPDFGLERELDWLKNLHDWLISKKNRYWGLALPLYECEKCGHFEVLGSKEELKEKAVEGWDQFVNHTPHKPWIDKVKINCTKCGALTSRIDDVGNVWLDAGIVPFSTLVDPLTKKVSYTTDKKYWCEWFPAQFITESFPGQFKNWFYVLIAMSTALEKTAPFKTVLGYSSVLAEDGRAMHKSWGNSIEFNEGADKMGVDVMRWLYARTDPTKNLLFGYKKAEEVKRVFHIPLWNTVKFLLTYQELDEWKPSGTLEDKKLSVLDQWILARLYEVTEEVRKSLEKYNGEKAALSIENFVTDLSTWYIRLSRDRTWSNSTDNTDKDAFYTCLHFVLQTLSIVLSPMLPFFSEELYKLLDGKSESVHLENWPLLDKSLEQFALLSDMTILRAQTETAHAKRKELGLKVRQPLAHLTSSLPVGINFDISENIKKYATLLEQEVNVKKVNFVESKEKSAAAEFDTTLTSELEEEGKVRELIRAIQQKRKEAGCAVNEKVEVTMPHVKPDFIESIKLKVLAHTIHLSDSTEVAITRT